MTNTRQNKQTIESMRFYLHESKLIGNAYELPDNQIEGAIEHYYLGGVKYFVMDQDMMQAEYFQLTGFKTQLVSL